jgi:hypothetical protein
MELQDAAADELAAGTEGLLSPEEDRAVAYEIHRVCCWRPWQLYSLLYRVFIVWF